jgi:hypothetical protein
MDFDQLTARDDAGSAPADRKSHTLNTWVAITVALLASFSAVCKVKDDNIGQAMQQAQADRNDHWGYYQAHNIRQEVAKGTLVQLRLAAAGATRASQRDYATAIARYDSLSKDQGQKKDSVRKSALQDQITYDALNYRDDQFDLSDSLVALAISLLALTALTQRRWLFFIALVPTLLGVLMGLAGLLAWRIHPDALSRMLS